MRSNNAKLWIILVAAAFALACYFVLFRFQRRSAGEMLALMRLELGAGNYHEIYSKYLSEDYRATVKFEEFCASGPFARGDWRSMRLLNPDVDLLAIPLNVVYRSRICAIISMDRRIPLIYKPEYDHKLAIPLRRSGVGWVIDGEIYAP